MAAHPLNGETALGRTDGYIYGMIRVGRVMMPAYGHQIGHYDRWHLVNYVRQLQGLLEVQTEAEAVENADEAEADAASADSHGGAGAN